MWVLEAKAYGSELCIFPRILAYQLCSDINHFPVEHNAYDDVNLHHGKITFPLSLQEEWNKKTLARPHARPYARPFAQHGYMIANSPPYIAGSMATLAVVL